MAFETSKVCPAYRHLGVADVLALGDELNRFGVLCMGLPAIPAPGLIPNPPGRRVSPGLAGSRQVSPGPGAGLALVVWCDALPPSLYGDL